MLRLRDKASHLAGVLSGGERKLLELGRALMSRPRVCRSTSHWPASTRRWDDGSLHVERLREERAMTFLFIEHDLDVVLNHAGPRDRDVAGSRSG